jgi:hypothetical protein
MSTQYTSPQPSFPPQARPAKFVPGLIPEIVALAAVPGEGAPSQIGVPEVLFRLVDGRKWYVPPSVADEIYRMGIVARQQLEVTKTGRAKHEVRIVALQAHLGGAPVVNGAGAYANAPVPNSTTTSYTSGQHSAPAQQAPPDQPVNAKFLAAYCVAVDVLLETKAYAQRKGLALEIHCEDIRCLAATLIIDQQKGGAR